VVSTTNWSQLTLRGYVGMSVVISNGTGCSLCTTGNLAQLVGATTNGLYPAGFVWNRPNN
jgi:hypothetical protein